jgi:hypothetical protein
MIEQKDKNGYSCYYPVFLFQAAGGIEHTIHSSWGTFPPAFEVGDTVPVLYRANYPTNAKIDSLFSVWGLSLISGSMFGIELPTGIVIWFWPAIVAKFNRKPAVSAA